MPGYSIEYGSSTMYSPSMPLGAGLTYGEAYPDSNGNYSWGYAYLGNAGMLQGRARSN